MANKKYPQCLLVFCPQFEDDNQTVFRSELTRTDFLSRVNPVRRDDVINMRKMKKCSSKQKISV